MRLGNKDRIKASVKLDHVNLELSKDCSDRKVGMMSRLPGRLSRYQIGFWNERKCEEVVCLVM